MFNLINYPAICDESIIKLFAARPETYIKVDGGVYVPPPSASTKAVLAKILDETHRSKVVPGKTNIIIHTCKPCNNWRLKHVGSKYSGVLTKAWYNIVIVENLNVDINHIMFTFIDELLKNNNEKCISISDVDALDITNYFSEHYGMSTTLATIEPPRVFSDANLLINHESEILHYVKTKIASSITTITQH